MKKFFTLAAAVLASFSLWAATESNPTSATKDTDVAGTSYTIPGTYIAGSGSAKAGAMPDKGIKFRINKPAGDLKNAIEFKVNEGYVINAIQLVGITNTDNKAATVGSIYVDGAAWNGTFNGALPAKNAEAASDIQITGIAAAQSVVFVFSDLGEASQGNICYTVTYEEAVQKEVDHVVETLISAAINGVALDETEMSKLLNNEEFEDLAYYVEAPTVTFTVQTDTYYVGETEPSTKSEKIDVVAELAAGMWMAQLTVNNETTYTVRATKPETRTITFMDGETVLGTEVVAKGDPSTKHANFETKPLAKFEGWFRNSNLTSQIDIETYAINEDQILYGKFVKVYAQSLNFEQIVMANGKSHNIKNDLLGGGYDFKDIDALDSLNNSKGAARNEPYLGLKIKKQGGYIACNVLPGTTIRIKFGYVAETVLAIAGNDTIELTPTDNKIAALQFPIMVETLVKLQTTSDKTVVIKQIMVDEPVVDLMYPITYEAAEHGKVEGWTVAFNNEEVTITATPDDGYKVADVKVNGTSLNPVDGIYKFNMISDTVTVSASFEEGEPVIVTDYNITIAEMQNGSVTADKTQAAEGEIVTLTVTPAEGYKVADVKVNGTSLNPVENVYTFTMPAEDVTITASFVEDEPVIVTEYNITIAEMQNGSVTADKVQAAEGEIVTLTVTPAEGYKVADVKVNGTSLNPVENVYTFTMPAEDVTITATFEQSQGIEDIHSAKQAVKRLENGFLFIEKGGVLYNAQGNVVK